MAIKLGGRGPGHMARASSEAPFDAPALPTAPAATTFSQTAKSTFQVFSDAISLRLGGLQYSGLDTAGDGTAALATSPDTGHERDQVLKFATAGGEGAAWAAQDIRYQPHDADRDSFATTSLVSLASGFWKATLAVDGKGGRFFAGYAEATNQATAAFSVGFMPFGGGWRVRVNGLAYGRVLPLGAMVDVRVAWTATTLTVSTRKQGETGWKAEYTGTGLSISALRSIRYGLWSPAYAAASVWFSDVALAETFADIDRDFWLAGSGTRDVSQAQANVALVIPDGLLTDMNGARLRWAAGSDPSSGTATSWVSILGKVHSVLPLSITGLTHNTAYSYQIEIGDIAGNVLHTSGAYRFRTLADAGTAAAAEIAIGSCEGQAPWCHPYTHFEHITDNATADYLGTFHLGDQGYEAGILVTVTDGYPEMDPPESADDYEFQLRDWACDTSLVTLFERGMVWGQPDDHQFINGFDGTMRPGGSQANTLASAWGSAQSSHYSAGTKLSDIYTAGIAAFEAWFSGHWIDRPSAGALYKHRVHGKVEVIHIDTRTERFFTAGKYVSDTQMAWIKARIDAIAATTGLVLFVGQGAFSTYSSKSDEGWERLAATQYAEFVDYCCAGIDPAVKFAFVNGDDHIGFARHFLVRTTANPTPPANFLGEIRASGGAVGEFETSGIGHSAWWLPPADIPSSNSFLRVSPVRFAIGANADTVDTSALVGAAPYTNTMLSASAFSVPGIPAIAEWWDASDNATAWSDTGATTPAVAGSSSVAALTGKITGALPNSTSGPGYVTDATTGLKCLSFTSATPQRLQLTSALVTSLFEGSLPLTVLAAVKRNTAGVAGTFLAASSSTGVTDQRMAFFATTSDLAGSLRANAAGASVQVNSTGAAFPAGQWVVVAYVFTGSKMLTIVDGTILDAQDMATPGDITPINRLVLGARWQKSTNAYTGGWDGQIGEIIVIADRRLSRSVLDAKAYLKAKWHN